MVLAYGGSSVERRTTKFSGVGCADQTRRAANDQKDWDMMESSCEAENPRKDDKKAERAQQRHWV